MHITLRWDRLPREREREGDEWARFLLPQRISDLRPRAGKDIKRIDMPKGSVCRAA